MTKKLLSLVLVLALCLASTTMVFAGETEDMAGIGYPGTNTETSVGGVGAGDTVSQSVDVYGYVQAIDVKATVTLAAYFVINPNAAEGSQFIAPDITVANGCNAPLKFAATSFVSTGDAPDVVNEASETWATIGRADTLSKIAIGLKPTAGGSAFTATFFDAEGSQAPIELFPSVAGGSSDKFTLDSKFGLAWGEAKAMKYAMTMLVEIAD